MLSGVASAEQALNEAVCYPVGSGGLRRLSSGARTVAHTAQRLGDGGEIRCGLRLRRPQRLHRWRLYLLRRRLQRRRLRLHWWWRRLLLRRLVCNGLPPGEHAAATRKAAAKSASGARVLEAWVASSYNLLPLLQLVAHHGSARPWFARL